MLNNKPIGIIETKTGNARYSAAQQSKDQWIFFNIILQQQLFEISEKVMEAKLIFKELIRQIGNLLKEHLYKKQSNTFYLNQNENFGLITFQKSVSSTSSKIFFTINIGIFSNLIGNFFDSEKYKKKPSMTDCHWQQRLSLLIFDKDTWWAIDENTNLIQLVQEI